MNAQVEFDQVLFSELNRCRKWIEDALAYGGDTHDFEDIAAAIYAGKMQFWPSKNACAVTEIITYPKKKVLHVFLAGGKMSEILDMQAPAAEWGQKQGCTDMTIAGRKGWARVLKKFGYEHRLTALGLEI